MAHHFSDNSTDQNFADSVVDAIDEGYVNILVVGTTRPFIDALLCYVAQERQPEKVVSSSHLLRYTNSQTVRFIGSTPSSCGMSVDRVLIHPLVGYDKRLAVIPCERPNPTKLTPLSG